MSILEAPGCGRTEIMDILLKDIMDFAYDAAPNSIVILAAVMDATWETIMVATLETRADASLDAVVEATEVAIMQSRPELIPEFKEFMEKLWKVIMEIVRRRAREAPPRVIVVDTVVAVMEATQEAIMVANLEVEPNEEEERLEGRRDGCKLEGEREPCSEERKGTVESPETPASLEANLKESQEASFGEKHNKEEDVQSGLTDPKTSQERHSEPSPERDQDSAPKRHETRIANANHKDISQTCQKEHLPTILEEFEVESDKPSPEVRALATVDDTTKDIPTSAVKQCSLENGGTIGKPDGSGDN